MKDPCRCAESRQFAQIQRIGRIGYWEYDPADQNFALPAQSRDMLCEISGRDPLLVTGPAAVLPERERKRFMAALAQAVDKQLEFSIELAVDLADNKSSHLSVRGMPAQTDTGRPIFAGTFRDITREKQTESEREEVITQLNALLDCLPQGVTVFDEDLRLILWNAAIYDVLGLPQGAVYKYVRFEDLIRYPAERGEYGPGDPEELVRERAAVARRFQSHRFERSGRDGRVLLVEGYPFRFGGKVSGFVTTYTDITERKQSEEQLARQNNVLRTIIDNFPGAISLFDGDLRMAACNEQFSTLLELPKSLLDQDVVMFEDLIRYNARRGEYGPGDIEEKVAAIIARARQFEAHKLERIRPNGLALEVRGMPLPGGGFVSIYIDITERKRAEERIRNLALHDPLTGLPNRLNLNDQLEMTLERARDGDKPFALLFLDLDGFKKVNDTLGHDSGDELLVRVATELKASVRETDVVARLGGDEFVILLLDIDNETTPDEIAGDIIGRLAAPFDLAKGTARIGTSIGIALYPSHGRTREFLLKAADEAMYAAKAAGRGTWRHARG